MKTTLDCIPCFVRQSLEAARYSLSDEAARETLVKRLLRMLSEADFERSPPVMAQAIHRMVREETGVDDPYGAAKERINALASQALPALRTRVVADASPLRAAATYAVVANAIDMGIATELTESEVRDALDGTKRELDYAEWERFEREVERAERILYLADNAGEIVVDRLLIEALQPHRVTLAVRGQAVLNDATRVDARQVGLHELVEITDNGSDAPGTVLEDCSEAFRRRFSEADLIIAKGQGNFETLCDTPGNIVFLFKVKCPLVAQRADVEVGAHCLLFSRHDLTPSSRPDDVHL